MVRFNITKNLRGIPEGFSGEVVTVDEFDFVAAERAAFENEVAINDEIISRLTVQVAELENEIEEAFKENCGGCMRGDEVIRDSDAGWRHLPIGIVCLSQQLRERAYQRKERANA